MTSENIHVNSHFSSAEAQREWHCPNESCRNKKISPDEWDNHLLQHVLRTLDAEQKQDDERENLLLNVSPSATNNDHKGLVTMAIANSSNATLGVIDSMQRMLQISKHGPTTGSSALASTHGFLCRPETPHFKTMSDSSGWGCGYLNASMLLTSILGHPEYGPHLANQLLDRTGECNVPNIATMQRLIEQGAWRQGIDPVGAAQLNYKLLGTKKWIGTSEVASLLIYLKIGVHVLEVLRPDRDGSHTSMLDFVQRYFEGSNNPVRITPWQQWQPRITITTRPCLYLQYQGHSQTIIGIEKAKSGKRHLLLFDPSRTLPNDLQNDTIPFGEAQKVLTTFRFDETKLSRNNKYQIIMVTGINEGVNREIQSSTYPVSL